MTLHAMALSRSLAAYAQNRHYLLLAEGYFTQLARYCEAHHEQQNAAAAYHQLGMVAQHQGNMTAAEHWYRKGLEIKERLGNENARI